MEEGGRCEDRSWPAFTLGQPEQIRGENRRTQKAKEHRATDQIEHRFIGRGELPQLPEDPFQFPDNERPVHPSSGRRATH